MLLDQIPFAPDFAALYGQLMINPESDFAAEIRVLADKAAAVARPKALFLESFIDARDEDAVTVDGVVLTSRVLRENLGEVERVFPYVATCGVEFDAVMEGEDDDFLRYALDCIKEAALGAALQHLHAHLNGQYGLGHTASMNPGSGDVDVWPIEQQAPLFALLGDVEGQTGVRLSDTFLMHPNKTVSGIIFTTEADFVTCQLCHREGCPNRRAPFNQELWCEKHGVGVHP